MKKFLGKSQIGYRHSLAPNVPYKSKNLAMALKNWKKKTFHSMSYFTQLRRLISNILWKTVGLFLPSTTEILDFIVSLSTLPVLNDFLQEYDFVMIILGDFSTTKKIPKNHFKLVSLIFRRITRWNSWRNSYKRLVRPHIVYISKVLAASVLL